MAVTVLGLRTAQGLQRWELTLRPGFRERTSLRRAPAGTAELVFESPVMQFGDIYEFDFSDLEPDLYRYNTFLGQQRIPGLVDTRPSR